MNSGSANSITRDQILLNDWNWVVKFGNWWFSTDSFSITINGSSIQLQNNIYNISFSEDLDFASLNYSLDVQISLILSEDNYKILTYPLIYNKVSLFKISKSLGWDKRIEYAIDYKISNPQFKSKDEPISFSIEPVNITTDIPLPYVKKISDIDLASLGAFSSWDGPPERFNSETAPLIWGKIIGSTYAPVIKARLVAEGSPTGEQDKYSLDRTFIAAGHKLDNNSLLTWYLDSAQYDYVDVITDTTITANTKWDPILQIYYGTPDDNPSFIIDDSFDPLDYDINAIDKMYVYWDGTKPGLGADYGGYDLGSCIKFLLSYIPDIIDWADLITKLEDLKRFDIAFWVNDDEANIIDFIVSNFDIFGIAIIYTKKGLSIISRPYIKNIKKDYIWNFIDGDNCKITNYITEINNFIYTDVQIKYGKNAQGYSDIYKIGSYTALKEGGEESSIGIINSSILPSSFVGNNRNIKNIETIAIYNEKTARIVADETLFWEGRPTVKLDIECFDPIIQKVQIGDLVKYVNDDFEWEKYGYISKVNIDTNFNYSVELTLLDI